MSMSILTREPSNPKPIVKPRPFGEGIIVDASSWPAWTDAHRYTIPATALDAPTPGRLEVPATFDDDELAPLEPDPETIPADVTRIRIDGPVSSGVYTATTDGHGRREWADEGKPGSRLLAGFADKRYREGRVAILPHQLRSNLCEADPIDHKAESVAWKLGFDLGREGEDPAPLAGVSPRVRMAFASGLEEGGRQRDLDVDAESERWFLLDKFAAGRTYHDAEWAEMRMSPRS
jgi:hypothetical protein